MNDLEIRPAALADAAAISELLCRNALVTLAPHYTEAQMAAFQRYYSTETVEEKLREQDWFCAILAGKIVGTIGLRGTTMVGFYTDPDLLGKGIGKALLAHLEDFAREKGLEKIDLTASPAATTFYLKHGFVAVKPVHMTFAGEKFWETLMVKRLIG